VTLRGLEVFESLARTGSVAATANDLGMSAPAVSQQMKNLSQRARGRTARQLAPPMTLTPAGRVLFLTGGSKARSTAARTGTAISTRWT
jgi:DNA-binding transcriptional LysR family regulator